MTGKYVDIDYILGRISNYYPFITDVSTTKVKEFIWDIIGRLGLEDSLYNDNAIITIENSRGNLPNNLYDMTEGMVRELESRIPLRLSTNIFHDSEDCDPEDGIIDQVANLEYFCTSVPNDKCDPQIYTYKLSENHIFTGLKEGKVEISYRAFPIDKYGDPLVPDNEKLISAVVSFIAERYAFIMVMLDKLSERKYAMIEQEYLFNLASARTSNKIPDLTKMDIIRNRLHSTNDGSRMFDTSFRDHGKKYE